MYSSVHHVTGGLFITLQHPACVVLMYSSVHHFTGGLFTTLRHPACVVLWYLPSRHERQPTTGVTYQNLRCCKIIRWFITVFIMYPCHCYGMNRNQFQIVFTAVWSLLNFRLLGFKGFIIFYNLRLLGYKEFILFSNLRDVIILFFYFLILGMLQSCFWDGGQGGNICWLLNQETQGKWVIRTFNNIIY